MPGSASHLRGLMRQRLEMPLHLCLRRRALVRQRRRAAARAVSARRAERARKEGKVRCISKRVALLKDKDKEIMPNYMSNIYQDVVEQRGVAELTDAVSFISSVRTRLALKGKIRL